MSETERIVMKTKYKDLTIWITGASSGIGAALTIAFAKQVLKALTKGEEYIIVAGTKEKLATKVNRLSPPKLYKLIRESQVK